MAMAATAASLASVSEISCASGDDEGDVLRGASASAAAATGASASASSPGAGDAPDGTSPSGVSGREPPCPGVGVGAPGTGVGAAIAVPGRDSGRSPSRGLVGERVASRAAAPFARGEPGIAGAMPART